MIRLLHTADWQMGRQYGRFEPEDAAALSEARFSAIERIAALANELQVDAVLVAGDVFDLQTLTDRTLRRTFNATQGFTGPWIMIPGNHDAALAENIWSRAKHIGAIPENVHTLLLPEVREFPEIGIAILPAPLTQRHTHTDLTEWFDYAITSPALLRIGLAHGSVQGILAAEIDSANPIAPDRAQRARLDYLALGDWHGMKSINERTWYSGTPEQERFKDNGAGQALLVEFSDERVAAPKITPYPVGQYQWQQWESQLSVGSDLDLLLERLKSITKNTVLSIKLSGQISLEDYKRLQEATDSAHANCRSLQLNQEQLHLVPSESDLADLHVDGYLNEVLAELKAMQETNRPNGSQSPSTLPNAVQPADSQVAGDALVLLTNAIIELGSIEKGSNQARSKGNGGRS
ncbi:predicted metallophosphoesterase [gamma proteobacterium HdN1]|nr:predicted metallophosphoesterase [gamma proteobacterium HdN1]